MQGGEAHGYSLAVGDLMQDDRTFPAENKKKENEFLCMWYIYPFRGHPTLKKVNGSRRQPPLWALVLLECRQIF